MQKKYPDQFKLLVMEDYYTSPLGVRSIALKYNLPSKNYINIWEKELINKGLLPEGSTKPVKSVARSKESLTREDTRTQREIYYENEISRLKAHVDYLESLESLQPFICKKTKNPTVKVSGDSVFGKQVSYLAALPDCQGKRVSLLQV